MLIAAVPPLVIGWPPQKTPVTGMIMNFCVFGAVALGPTIGFTQAAAGGWRPLFWIVTGVGCLALVFALLTFEDQPPQDPEAPWDVVAILLAAGGCGAAFFGAGELEARGVADARAIGPLVGGIALIVVLVVTQYRKRRPLMPVKAIASTLPVGAIALAMSASAAAFGLMELTLQAAGHRFSPGRLALLFLPEFGAAAVTAVLFGGLFRTRFTPLLAFSGMAVLVGAAALLLGVAHAGGPILAAGAGLIGLGVGASVSPALFIAGFSLRSSQIQRVFALIELLRAVGAFLVAPVLVFLASTLGPTPSAGVRGTVWICLGIAGAGALLVAAIFLTGGGRLQTPDLERWQHGEPAWDTPRLLSRVLGRPCD